MVGLEGVMAVSSSCADQLERDLPLARDANSSNNTPFMKQGREEAGEGALFGIINMITFKLFIKHTLKHPPILPHIHNPAPLPSIPPSAPSPILPVIPQQSGALQNINLHMKGESETASQLAPERHPLQSISEVTICRLTESVVNRKEEDIDAILQNKYNTEERKLIIVDRTKGKIIDSRIVDIHQEIKDSLQQSFFVPASMHALRSQPDQQEYVYELIGSAYDGPSQGQGGPGGPSGSSLGMGKGKSIWEQSWRQYDKIHQSFLQSILKNNPLQFINHLQKKVSQLPIDINFRYQSNWAPLHYAAMHSSIQIISRLINDPRIDVNALTDFHETPLHIAAKANKLENCLLLMSAGVCIDKRDCDQNTALHYATEYGYRDIAQALLEHEASPLIKNCTGMTAIDLASANLADLFRKYKEEQEREEDRMYRNRNNHRNMIEKMLALNYQEAPSKEGQSQSQPVVQSGQGRDARFFRKQHILKLYQFIRQNQRMETITLSSFKFYKKIGEGAFGEVYLVRRDKQQNFLALKAIRKERVYGTNLYRYIQTEKDILSLLNHPFIVRLRYAFQTETYLFLAMDYCEGGDLSRLLEKRKKFSESQVRLYACEILLGLEALHKHGIIYRDLKPQNIVLDREGHALITDFGLSKKTDNLDAINKSFCGTPAYLPLEIINKKGHTRMADWYEYGVVLYELFTGCPPYYADTKQELYDLVRKGVIRFTKNTPELFKDLVKKLLSQNPEKRLGFEKDAESIREHPWFADVDWEQVIERRLEMPPIENRLKIGEPIKTKFHDVRSEKFQIPMWSFME